MEIKIDRFGINGEGIGIISQGERLGKIAFVYGAMPDEVVDCELIEEKKQFCKFKISKIISLSDHRVKPICKYFEVCGGCQMQHIDQNLQLQIKKDSITQTIKKVSSLDVNCNDVVSKNVYNYRNKMVFPIVNVNGQNIIGMFKEDSHSIVDIDYCYICNDNKNK